MPHSDWPLGIEPGQEVEIDLFQPRDAPGVTALFRDVYGEDYPIKVYYDPGRLAHENAAGTLISLVSRTPRGEVVGHISLFNSAPNPRLYELGAGGVLSSYRNTAKLLTRMMNHGPRAAAERFGVEAVFGDPVCTHVYSQKICHALGWVSQALEVDLMPASLYDRSAPAEERVSSLMDFITVKPKPHLVHLPAAYEEALRFMYQGLDDAREIELSRQDAPAGSLTRIESRVIAFAQLARLAVWEIGEDLEGALEREAAAALAQGARVTQVWLRLDCPWVGWAVERLRRRGYFLGGLLPRWFDQDGLLMQRLLRPPHWDSVILEYERGRALLEIVRRDWERAQEEGRAPGALPARP